VRRILGRSLRDLIAVVVLVAVALVVGGYILSNQRLYLPDSVPLVGTDFVDYKVEFENAKSVTPGQGQTVAVAGVTVGEIADVRLRGGRAVVTMKIRRRYARLYRDATALLRPRTGLEDMVIELVPGTREAGRMAAGATIPVAQTQPTVQFDEILATLDRDTRDYLVLLVGGAGEGLRDNGRALSATLKRFEPLNRDLRRINGMLAERRQNVRRSIASFRTLAQALGEKDTQLAQLVETSNTVFGAFARQDRNLRATLRELPGALEETQSALTKVDAMATELGPAAQALRPFARALGPSLRRTRPFLRATTPVIADQLRPFARDARPSVQALRPAADDLAQITPDLADSFQVLNAVLNTLAYNPPGQAEEGYLFWASWLNHTGASLFSSQDAHGPIRRGLVLADCPGLQFVLPAIRRSNPVLGTLTDLLNPPKPAGLCPGAPAAPAAAAASVTARTPAATATAASAGSTPATARPGG